MQQHLELAITELSTQVIDGAPSAAFIKFDEFDMFEALEQAMFQFPDDPGDTRSGPVILNGSDNGYNVCGVTESGKPQNAYVFGLLNC